MVIAVGCACTVNGSANPLAPLPGTSMVTCVAPDSDAVFAAGSIPASFNVSVEALVIVTELNDDRYRIGDAPDNVADPPRPGAAEMWNVALPFAAAGSLIGATVMMPFAITAVAPNARVTVFEASIVRIGPGAPDSTFWAFHSSVRAAVRVFVSSPVFSIVIPSESEIA